MNRIAALPIAAAVFAVATSAAEAPSNPRTPATRLVGTRFGTSSGWAGEGGVQRRIAR